MLYTISCMLQKHALSRLNNTLTNTTRLYRCVIDHKQAYNTKQTRHWVDFMS